LGIPILEDIFNGIKFLINFFMDKAPKPIKILFFLLFLIAFGNMIVWLLHLTGLHCNTDKEVIKTDTFDIVTNVKILWSASQGTLTGQTATVQEAHPYTRFVYWQSALDSCTWYMKNDSGSFTICNNINTTDCFYYYRQADCHDCTPIDVGWIYNPNSLINWNYEGEVCGDGARYQDNSWFKNIFACESLCNIPEHYSWNYEDGLFECEDLDYCGLNATEEPDTEIDFLLKQAGGELLYPTNAEKSYDRLITIKCTDNYNPELTFFGIPIFSYKIWLMLIIISIMFLFLSKIVRH